MKTTLQKIEAIKSQVGDLSHNVRCTFSNVRALQSVRDERKVAMLFELENHPAPTVLCIPNSVAHPFNMMRTQAFTEYTTIQSTLALYEASDEWKSAEAAIQPLLDEIARLEALHEAEVAAIGEKSRLLHEAQEAALERAKQAALHDPAVVATRAALEKLADPAPAPATRKGKEPQAVS